MSRIIRSTAISAVAFGVGAALSTSAIAQTTPPFSPPLDAPTELTAPVSFELQPGAKSACVDTQAIEGIPAPTPPESRYDLAVEDGEDGALRVRLSSRQQADLELLIRVGADGSIGLEQASLPEGAGDAERQLLETVIAQLPELRLHMKSFSAGDPMYSNDELEQIFGEMFAALGGGGDKPDIDGGSFLQGETMLEGRRIIVFGGTLTLVSAADGLTITQEMQEAYDAATGMRVYSVAIARIPAPEGLDVSEIVFRQTTICSISGG